MQHLLPKTRRRGARSIAAVALGALALAMTASAASANGELRWTFENAYATGCSVTGLHCTWLGYMTNPAPGSGTRGSVSVTAPALGTTVTPTSPRGANVFNSFAFPTAAADAATRFSGGAQSLEFEGTIEFVSPPPPNGHGITMTVEDPRIELAGNGTGALFASGVKAAGVGTTAPYDRTKPVLDLDLTNVVVETSVDGTQTIDGIVPSIDEADYAFPANYAAGAGPDRTPNTFGSFSLALDRPDGVGGPPGPRGADGAAGPIGATGPLGPTGTTVTIVRRIQVARLVKAPFGRGSRRVRALRKGKLVARGRVRGKTVRLKLVEGSTRQLRGRYVLRVIGGKRRAVVRLG